MSSGFELMLVGMAIVFVFLAALVLAVTLLRVVVDRFFPAQVIVKPEMSSPSNGNESATIAAISAAVSQYRKKYQK